MNAKSNHKKHSPICLQVIDEIYRKIILGILPIGGLLPSIRVMSKTLRVSTSTVQKAYNHLKKVNIITTNRGHQSTIVSDDTLVEQILRKMSQQALTTLLSDLRLLELSDSEIIGAVKEKLL